MSGCCVGWSGKEGRREGRKEGGRVSRRSRMAFTGRGRTDGLAEAGDEVTRWRRRGERRRRRRAAGGVKEVRERERGLDLDVIPLGRSVLVPSPASVRWPRCEVLPGQKGRFVMKIRTPKIHKV